MWAHLRTAPNKAAAEMWRAVLEEEGIPVQVRPVPSEAHQDELASYRIYVPRDRVKVAEDLLRNL